jgi:hypothetical protein
MRQPMHSVATYRQGAEKGLNFQGQATRTWPVAIRDMDVAYRLALKIEALFGKPQAILSVATECIGCRLG